jgi:transcription elongation GreA/GreB family factor
MKTVNRSIDEIADELLDAQEAWRAKMAAVSVQLKEAQEALESTLMRIEDELKLAPDDLMWPRAALDIREAGDLSVQLKEAVARKREG